MFLTFPSVADIPFQPAPPPPVFVQFYVNQPVSIQNEAVCIMHYDLIAIANQQFSLPNAQEKRFVWLVMF